MGQEIYTDFFTENDSIKFKDAVRQETLQLKKYFDENSFCDGPPMCGLELEAWLVNDNFLPDPKSDLLVEKLNNELVVPEIAKFNFEINSEPFAISKNCFEKMEETLLNTWNECSIKAKELGSKTLMIGTLPTLRDHMLDMEFLSGKTRYYALNSRIMELQHNRPVIIDFEGRDFVHIEHNNVISECAATSLQVHFGVTPKNVVETYNASVIASSFVSAVCANSPFFLGKDLWDESRIPIFEQSINMKSFRNKDSTWAKRVTLGNDYVKKSIFELFLENLDGHPVLIPDFIDGDIGKLANLRLHNGTIWRWNRPLVGFDKEGRPGLRLEFRVPSAGPTVKDSIANMLFQILIVEFCRTKKLSTRISFKKAMDNFYLSCKDGLNAQINWIDGNTRNIRDLLIHEILPELKKLYGVLNICQDDFESYITQIIYPRVKSLQNGTGWQRSFVAAYGMRFQELLERYYHYQNLNLPVHLWQL